MGAIVHTGAPTQSPLMTSVFAFNLIVGVGALALPYAVNLVGYVFGCALIVLVGVLGFVSATFLVEAIANTTALNAARGSRLDPSLGEDDVAIPEEVPGQAVMGHKGDAYVLAPDDVSLTQGFRFSHLEMAHMAEALFPTWGQNLFYLCISVYLYGDLAIYAAAVPSTLTHFTGVDYHIFLAGFGALMVPWVFFDFAKTKYLQLLTLATRNIALLSMVVLSIVFIAQGKGNSHAKPVRPAGLSVAWGSIVYAFMVHHSIPSIIAPLKDKSRTSQVFVGTFVLVGSTYLVLSLSAIFAFAKISYDKCDSHPSHPCHLRELYTENFSSYNQEWLADFLTLFPVFTLTSNFPLISITLRNTLLTLFRRLRILERYPSWQRIVCCLLSPCPPLVLAFIVPKVSILVGFTGSYAGMFIMFIVPALLVKCSREQAMAELELACVPNHVLSSPFRHKAWIWVILGWAALSLVIITANNIIEWSS